MTVAPAFQDTVFARVARSAALANFLWSSCARVDAQQALNVRSELYSASMYGFYVWLLYSTSVFAEELTTLCLETSMTYFFADPSPPLRAVEAKKFSTWTPPCRCFTTDQFLGFGKLLLIFLLLQFCCSCCFFLVTFLVDVKCLRLVSCLLLCL